MKELRTKYQNIKAEALQLMKSGNITAYLAKLQEAADVKTQLAQLNAT